ncbi:MAG TPA: FAD-dependent oxidoreductase [Solirubrobacteraceae bacterium]|jgi:predicted NAD/FAD-binding protein|nr:FAD-dependent oxidoreductase [Solirubrobacteraceae bacterium]
MRIAIVGGGVSGLIAAHLLHRQHEITLFEAAGYLGGHTHTIRVDRDDGTWDVDTGFIVLNDRNYPNFNRILADAGVPIQSTHMGFSVKGEDTDFEYAGTPTGVFAQRRNIVDPTFWRMLSDMVRFNRELPHLLDCTEPGPSLGDWVEDNGYSKAFIDRLIVPQASAVWSADPASMWAFPARFLAEFFSNHGMLGFRDRPQWQTVVGGSQTYVRALSAEFADRIRLATPVTRIRRDEHGVDVHAGGSTERFDEVILACHSDQALAMLDDPSPAEHDLLRAFPYQPNEAVLHTDATLLPRRRATWQAWNYHLFAEPRPMTTVTYYMNHLQKLTAPVEFCVTLNMTDRIDPSKIIEVIPYAHPVYTQAGVAAQGRWREISGVRRTHYCGAYWGWGFHEDGVVSAQRACEAFGFRVRA